MNTNKRVINKKTFYSNYNDNFDQVKAELRSRQKVCQFCGHDGTGSNILTTAHLDQNPKNDSQDNLKVLCRSCHIRHDQKYHNFSMESSKKTDNSYLQLKSNLRLETVNKIDKQIINVLEAFAGDGKIWKEVQSKTDKIINVTKIEIKNGKKGFYLNGDNNKFLPLFDFKHFDIIDVDAYGSPYNQLEVIFEKEFNGYVHCTFIQSGMGQLNKGMLKKIGYSEEMFKKARVMLCSNGMAKMERYLNINGVNEITGHFINRKNYFYFIIGN